MPEQEYTPTEAEKFLIQTAGALAAENGYDDEEAETEARAKLDLIKAAVRAEERAEAHAMHEAYRAEVVAEIAVAVHEECAWEEIAKWCGGTVQSGPDGTDSGEYISWIDIPGVGQAHDRMWIVQRHDLSFELRWEVEGPSEKSVETIRVAEHAKRPDREQVNAAAEHLRGMIDSLDEHVGNEEIAEQLEEARRMVIALSTPEAREVPTAEELLDTRAGLALANAAWKEGAAHWKRAQEVQEAGEGWHKPVSPYSAPLLARMKAEGPRAATGAREVSRA